MKIIGKILLVICIIASIVGIGYLGYGYYLKLTKKSQNPIATIEVENFGTIKVELYPNMAPNTVSNFIKLAQNNYYNGKVFHRTIPDFMIQGGSDETASIEPKLKDLKEDLQDEAYNIKGEFIANGYDNNTLKFKKGVIAMARADYSQSNPALTSKGYNSASAQFFIMNNDNENLNGLYAGFGKVLEGQEVVDKIANVEVVTRDSNQPEGLDKPKQLPVIKSISVETFGEDYGIPNTMKPFDYYKWLMTHYQNPKAY